ncbi:MAG: hypothetical protein HYY99_00350 [Candidatus Colwellbacteria bacterium]|nr:hypothetical protein [Candidatus Colwellbacteria bacterium]
MSLDKTLARAVRWLLVATIVIPPFITSFSLYFPFVAGKAYLFRFLVELSFALWVFLATRSREYWPNFRNPGLIATFVFLLGLVITALLGVDPVNSFFSNTERSDGVIQFFHWVLYLVMIASLFKSKEDWRQGLKIFVAVAAALAVYAWFKEWISPELPYIPRLQGSFGNPS